MKTSWTARCKSAHPTSARRTLRKLWQAILPFAVFTGVIALDYAVALLWLMYGPYLGVGF